MPLYLYRCPECLRVREELRKVDAGSGIYCNFHTTPIAMEKIPAPANFELKGHGFHKNDYPKD